jgi:hypothetical protein
MDDSKIGPSQLWSWVGKVAVLFGLLWVLIQLYNHFKGSDYSLSAYGDYAEFIFPGSLESELQNLQKFNNLQHIEELLQDVKNDKIREHAALSIKKHFANEYPSILAGDLPRLESLWFFEIKNEGKKEIKDLELELPFSGYYKTYPIGERVLDPWFKLRIRSRELNHLISHGEKQEPVLSGFDRNVRIPSLRPSNIISIIVWSRAPASEIYAKDTKVTSSEGVYAISYPTKVRGVWGWLYVLSAKLGHLLILCAIAASLALFYLFYHKGSYFSKRAEKNGGKDTTEQNDETKPDKTESAPNR